MEKIVLIGLYMAIVFVFLYIVKKIADGITRFDDDAAIEMEGNVAVALRRFGLYLGFCTAMAGIMSGGLSKLELTFFLMDGAIATVIFFAANYLNDYVIIPGVRNNDLIRAGNVPTGMVEAGSFIATGVLLNGAFSGDVGNFLTAIVFFLLGQIMLVIAVRLHQTIYRFDVTAAVLEGNVSAGLSVAGLLVAYSFILRTSITGDFAGWVESLTFFAMTAAAGIFCLLLFQRLADVLFLPKTKISEQIKSGNMAAMILVQGLTIALALVISRIMSF
jgi:uncharacterized membrane protein YjfL (UPF0719 family)